MEELIRLQRLTSQARMCPGGRVAVQRIMLQLRAQARARTNELLRSRARSNRHQCKAHADEHR